MQEDRSGNEQQPPEYPSAWAAPSDAGGEQVPQPDGDSDQARLIDSYPATGSADAAGASASAGGTGDEQAATAYPGTTPPPAPYRADGDYGTAGGGYGAGGYGAAGSGYGAGGGYSAGGGYGEGGYGYPGAGYQAGAGYQGGAGYPGGYQGGGYQGGGYQGGGYQGGGYGYGGYPPGDPGYGMPGGYGGPPGAYGQRPKKRASRAITYVLVAALAAGVGAGTVLAMRHNGSNTSSFSVPGGNASGQQPASGGANSGGTANRSAAKAVAGAVSPGIVDVISTPSYQPGGTLEGTGMVLTSNGLVLTNNHVVEGTSHEIAEIANNTTHKYSVTVLGTDATDDVALLKLNGASNLKTVPIGNSSTARVGQAVIALGNAEGQDGPPTVVTGTITDLNRSIEASDAGAGTTENLHDMLQTNAPIVEGDSGGALASTQGKVIGMNTAANTGTTGAPGSSMGFAIPINRAMAIAREIESHHGNNQIQFGYPAFLGVTVASSKSGPSTSTSPQQQLQQLKSQVKASESQGFGGLPGAGGGGSRGGNNGCLTTDQASAPSSAPNVSSGVLVGGVLCGTPVNQAGLTAGAVITAIDGQTIPSPASLTKIMGQYHPGEMVTVSWVSQSGQHHTSSLRLAPGPAK